MLKTLVFDFGNVLFKLDIDGCFQRLAKLCNLTVDEFLIQFESIIARYERGHIGDENFIWYLQQFNPTLNPRIFVDTWNSMLVGMDPGLFDLLRKLSKDYNLYLLSNINGLHERYIDRYLLNTYKAPHFLDLYFEQYFYSHQIKMRKPDKEIYQFVSDRIENYNPETLLFIDDNKENIKAAQSFGWRAQWHSPTSNLIDCIDNYIDI